MKKPKNFFLGISIFFVILLVLAIALFPRFVNYDDFAKCLTGEGMVLYGTDWCPHCQQQKEMFGSSVEYIKFVDCDISNECKEAGVRAFPTWAHNRELLRPGVQSFEELSKLTGC